MVVNRVRFRCAFDTESRRISAALVLDPPRAAGTTMVVFLPALVMLFATYNEPATAMAALVGCFLYPTAARRVFPKEWDILTSLGRRRGRHEHVTQS